MPTHFHTPRRFHPAYSLLGRLLRRVCHDTRHAESVYLVVVCSLALLLLLAQYLAWAFVGPAILAAPSGSTAMTFWASQLGGLLLLIGGAGVGFRPAVYVTLTHDALHLRQGTRTLRLDLHGLGDPKPVTALEAHRHWNRYARTQPFYSRLADALLLFRTPEGPVLLGLALEDRDALVAALYDRHAVAYGLPAASAA